MGKLEAELSRTRQRAQQDGAAKDETIARLRDDVQCAPALVAIASARDAVSYSLSATERKVVSAGCSVRACGPLPWLCEASLCEASLCEASSSKSSLCEAPLCAVGV